jgi:hypothetical protein
MLPRAYLATAGHVDLKLLTGGLPSSADVPPHTPPAGVPPGDPAGSRPGWIADGATVRNDDTWPRLGSVSSQRRWMKTFPVLRIVALMPYRVPLILANTLWPRSFLVSR